MSKLSSAIDIGDITVHDINVNEYLVFLRKSSRKKLELAFKDLKLDQVFLGRD